MNSVFYKKLWAKKNVNNQKKGISKYHSTLKPYKKFTGLILGIDPSLRSTGLALLKFELGIPVKLYTSKTIKIENLTTIPQCLGKIFQSVTTILEKFSNIHHVALEKTIYVQNFKVAQIMGAASGAAITAASIKNIEVFEYAPLRIKQAVVGFGNASKEQVAKTVMQILKKKEITLSLDETDAIAVAVCHAMMYKKMSFLN